MTTLPNQPITVCPFHATEADERECAAANDFLNRLHAEIDAEDPPLPLAERIAWFRARRESTRTDAWHVWEGDRVIARGAVHLSRNGENPHLAFFSIGVLPEFRRQGIGRTLLALIAETARRENRRLLLTDTNARVPAGELVLTHIGFAKALESHTNRLMIDDVDRDRLRDWVADGPVRAPGLHLGEWIGPYPEADIEAIADLLHVMNTTPRGDLEMEDMRITPAILREKEANQQAAGVQRWTLYAQESATGAFAGFTEIYWHPNRPHMVGQGWTGVVPAFRGRKIGLWLKAAMLGKILGELPDVRSIRTGNADSNAAMLAINHELGFRPYIATAAWQGETDRVLAYLAGA